jgi:AcrR family transcriptional regulator
MTGVNMAEENDESNTRERIRDAAIALFAEQGFDKTTIRGIAKAAGVSGGLLRHHFGSKDDLRAECDAHVMQQVVDIKSQIVLDGRVADLGFMSGAHPKLLTLYRYIARAAGDESPQAAAMFDVLVDVTAHWLQEHHAEHIDDMGGYAAVLTAMEIGSLNMSKPLSRALGADVFSPEGHLRLAKAKVEFYSRPLLDQQFAEQSRRTIDQLIEQHASKPKGI